MKTKRLSAYERNLGSVMGLMIDKGSLSGGSEGEGVGGCGKG